MFLWSMPWLGVICCYSCQHQKRFAWLNVDQPDQTICGREREVYHPSTTPKALSGFGLQLRGEFIQRQEPESTLQKLSETLNDLYLSAMGLHLSCIFPKICLRYKYSSIDVDLHGKYLQHMFLLWL